MGKKWDYDVPSVEFWKEVLRVLKPGAHLLSFGGTRTYHRMVCNIEDAGFEIRDQIQWLYGSGFPKSLDISKAIDKAAGAKRTKSNFKQIDGKRMIAQSIHAVCKICGKRQFSGNACKCPDSSKNAVTDAAKCWQGFGTALKPAYEPIVLARKPLSEKTVAKNVLKWGTGGLNIDGCRIDSVGPHGTAGRKKLQFAKLNDSKFLGGFNETKSPPNSQGRFPANLLLDEQAAEMLDRQSGLSSDNLRITSGGKNRVQSNSLAPKGMNKPGKENLGQRGFSDSGGASRFFYCAKASKSERGKDNNHPTVKPLKLMHHLVTLITPPNGKVLDPFAGSGTTGIACQRYGFDFVGIEKEKRYVRIAKKRLATI